MNKIQTPNPVQLVATFTEKIVCAEPAKEWHKKIPVPHHTDHREALFVVSGSTNMKLQDRVYSCQPGTVMLIDLYEGHNNDSNYENQGIHVWLFIFRDSIEMKCGYMEHGEYSWLVQHSVTSANLSRLLNEEWDAGKAGVFSPEIASVRILSIFQILVTELQKESVIENEISQTEKKITSIRQHVERYSGCFSNISVLTQMSGFSRAHFQRLFRKYTGMTVSACIDKARSQKLAVLKSEGAQMKTIAQELGFKFTASLDHWLTRKKNEAEKATANTKKRTGNRRKKRKMNATKKG